MTAEPVRTPASITVREAGPADQDGIWAIVKDIAATGDTYPFASHIDRTSALEAWIEIPRKTYVAVDAGEVIGTYYLKDNQAARGAHVANAGYMVASASRGRGLGRMLCAHSLDAAKTLGYRAMQYNLVVSTNLNAVKLWRAMGFAIVGTLPEAFDHKELGLVDAYVMYRRL